VAEYSPPGPRGFGDQGMSAAMNGSCVNVSIPDGWCPEFVQDSVNRFVIPNKEIT